MECVTIYTDASLCQQSGCAAYGAWIKYGENKSFKLSGPLKNKIKSPNVAELMAIANALSITIGRLKPQGVLFVVVTDSEHARTAINMKGATKNEELNELAKFILNLVPAHCSLKVNKVKAHSGLDGKRNYINNVVDKLAKKEMRKLRDSN